MDVNGTRFHLLLGKDDWAPLIRGSDVSPEADLFWDEARVSLSLRPLLFRFPTPPGDRLLRPQDRRGAARDRYGNWYWIAESGTEIRFLPADGRQSWRFWSAGDLVTTCEPEDGGGDFRPLTPPLSPTPWQLSGLAVTEHHYLVVGLLDPAGLLIFDLHAGGPPIQALWPSQVPFAPFDMAPALGGGVWILDREARYWALDRYLRVVAADQLEVDVEPPSVDDFQPEDGPTRQRPGRSFPAGISLETASPLEARHPLAIEALPDGTVLILDSDPSATHSVVYRYRFGQPLGAGVSLDRALVAFPDEPSSSGGSSPRALWGHDMAFLSTQETAPGQVMGTLYVVASDGNQTLAFELKADETSLSLELLPRYFPMRLYSGKALVAADQAVYYDMQERWLSLVEQPRPRYKAKGTFVTRVFDGKEPDCVWHRLFLDAYKPPGTEVLVESRAANNQDLLAHMSWQPEPRLYCRGDGPELPYYEPFSPAEARRDGAGTWELLFQRAQGRYLQLRLTLRGSGRSTPRLHALRVYYPRFSYLREYLPAAYQDDETSASFLDRFLANVEGLYTVLEGRIEQAQTLFDVRTTATEYLDWLAGWLGVVLDPAWEAERRRLFLSHAIELYNQRGTPGGLIRAIRLAIDPCPDETLFEEDVLDCGAGGALACTSGTRIARHSVRIVERFLTRRTPGVVYGDPSQVEGPGVTTDISQWSPDQGAEPLHQRFRDYLRGQYQDIANLNKAWEPETDYADLNEISFPPVRPANDAEAEDWLRFIRVGLGFTYAAVGADDQAAYQVFLARRYRYVDRLNAAYQLTGDREVAAFDQVALPAENDMPSDGLCLYDWIQFVSLVLPIGRHAHRFSVLVPTEFQSDAEALAQRLELVRRIVELEKPAHTDFEVNLYWALFRVGEARLGLDTLLGEGSRFVAVVLGKGYLAQGYLAPSHPWDVSDRIVAGRDRIGPDMVL